MVVMLLSCAEPGTSQAPGVAFASLRLSGSGRQPPCWPRFPFRSGRRTRAACSSSRTGRGLELQQPCGVLLPDVPRRLHPQPDEHEPDERDWNEDLPAQTHDLVVAVARECGANPEEQGADDENLEAEPDPARDPVE